MVSAVFPSQTPTATVYVRRLGLHHFAYLRSAAEGVDMVASAERHNSFHFVPLNIQVLGADNTLNYFQVAYVFIEKPHSGSQDIDAHAILNQAFK